MPSVPICRRECTRLLRAVAAAWVALLLLSPAISAQGPQFDETGGWETNAVDLMRVVSLAVSADLFSTDLGALAHRVAAMPPPDRPFEFARRLDILVRAGHRAQVARLIDRTAPLVPESGHDGLVYVVYHLVEAGEIEAAKRIYERLPRVPPAYNLVDRWIEATGPAGVDAWLAARATKNPDWFWHRVRFRIQQGTEAELLAPFVDDVRAHPEEAAPICRLLHLVHGTGRAVDLAWLPDASRLDSSSENFAVGASLFFGYREWRPLAVTFLERSLRQPFTDADAAAVRQLTCAWGPAPPIATDERGMRIFSKAAIAETYREQGRADLAQPLLEEIVAMSGGTPPDVQLGLLAGVVQRQSGMRVIETSILAREKENLDSPEYWIARAAYYRGRKELELAADTYRKGLERFPLNASGASAGQGSPRFTARYALLRGYAFVDRAGAARVIERDFRAVALQGYYAYELARLMVESQMSETIRAVLDPREDRLWGMLASRAEAWDQNDTELMAQAVRDLPAPERAKCWAKAIEVARSRSAADRLSLALVVANTGDALEAEPLLRASLRELKRDEESWRAVGPLVEILAQRRDWQGVRTLLVAEGRNRVVDARYSFTDLAVAAAAGGAPDEAMAFWKLVASMDRTSLRQLDSLVGLGLGPSLREFYMEMKRSDPSSWVPDAALRQLDKR